jgi:hypothetical protein
MITTKHLVPDLKKIPIEWVFETYCKLNERLHGQDVNIKSIFNPSERTPSMYIYFCKQKNNYKFKDFSTSRGGDALTLITEMYGISRGEAASKVIRDYNEFVLHNNGGYDIAEFKKYSKYQVSMFKTRDWNTLDVKYWSQYNIGSGILEHYNVKPLALYEMEKEQDGDTKKLKIEGEYIYGYFKKDGSLYKIYQPKVEKKKFLKVKQYIQGSEQLKNNDLLFIASSLKDGMCLKNMFKKYDFIAPDSENTMIKKDQLESIMSRYSRVYIIFDNDEAGRASTEKYLQRYPNIKPIYLDIEKDVADAVKKHGYMNTFKRIKELA